MRKQRVYGSQLVLCQQSCLYPFLFSDSQLETQDKLKGKALLTDPSDSPIALCLERTNDGIYCRAHDNLQSFAWHAEYYSKRSVGL